MKKLACVSGIITVSLLVFLLTGMADMDDEAIKALRQGNKQYESAAYEEAIKSYETGLVTSPEDKALNYNAAQSAYMMGEYEKAVKYYEKSEDSIDKFLSSGNAVSKLGDKSTDESEKTQHYKLAMQAYHDGIIKYPENVPLKYNYEVMKEKIKELSDNQDQENKDQENKDQENKEQENKDQENKEQENKDQEQKEQENKEQENKDQ